ncbi:182 kDa tankyrase-1-binding protein [Dromiciops gliroides]|uniref:182 kDa tankyrase-1-binding protein n=1 Tax=Dromiciops gliroides TaxID=33562 RepID=UPI001CC7041D|nr:182 kDa tankyrase-1-binding protein [Dromiciops gliroides]XP_043825804.1 182 kDa tankyrase-1-binding protein [Dromiciops gliroides]XP_043825805.1 182 kDa tankyrase-1-binding protein [Dromiciops gliroides]XP_043825806.1 182 kDa tankyrase-1-binding protein [Dromiciops gliroides]
MNLSTLRESSPMASRPPQEMDEELLPAGPEPGDSKAKPPVKPKPEPRTLPAKPALPAKPSLLVPLGPRPPRGPLAELPSARKMNMLAGPQPYGGSKRPLAFSPRPAPDTPSTGASPQEANKDEGAPATPPARCSAPTGVRKAPAPFRPPSDRFSTNTVEEILAKMDQPRKEGPPSPERLWGSRLTFGHDGSSHYGPRAYGPVQSPRHEEALAQSISRDLPQEEQGQEEGGQSPAGRGPAEPQEDQAEGASSRLEERFVSPDLKSNGDLASSGDLASTTSSHEASRSSVHPHHVPSSGPPSSVPHDSSPSPQRAPGPQSPTLPREEPPEPQKSLGTSFPSGDDPPEKAASPAEAPRAPTPEPPQVTSPQTPPPGGQFSEHFRTFPLEKKEEEGGESSLRPPHLEQRRFSEGVLRPPTQDPRKLGGSLAALPQGQGRGGGLEQPFGSGTESNWSLSQSFEWTFPTRPSGLGVWRLESPPPSPITEADDSGLSEGEGEEADGGRSSRPARPASRAQSESFHCGVSQNQLGDDRTPTPSKPPSELHPKGPDSPRPSLLQQAEEVAGTEEALAGLETPLPPTPEEAALPVLEPAQEQEPPLPLAQPCILFADAHVPEQATPSQEDAPDLAKAETSLTRPEGGDPPRMSPELRAPESDAGWLDKLLASPPPSANDARKATVPEQCETQMPSASPEGLLGWAQKDLKSEFGIGVDSHTGTFSASSPWAREGTRGYGIGCSGSSERDWVIDDGRVGAAQSHREWSHAYGIGQPGLKEEFDTSNGDQTKEHILGGDFMAQESGKADQLGTYSSQAADLQDQEFGKKDPIGTYSSQTADLQDREFGKRDSLGTYSSQIADLQDLEFGKRDSLGTYSTQAADLQDQEFGKRDSLGAYSSRDADLQDQEFGKRDSLGAYSSRDADLQDQEFGKKDSLGAYSSRDADLQDQEFGKKDPLGTYSSQAADLQDLEFEKRDSLGTYSGQAVKLQDWEFGKRNSLGTYSSQDADLQDQEFEKRNWMSDYGGSSKRDADCLERTFGERDLSGVFNVGHSEQQDEEFGKKDQSDSYYSREANREEMLEKETEGLYGPNTSNLQDQELGERDLTSWPKSNDHNHQGEFGKKDHADTYRSNDANRQSREFGKKDWPAEFDQQDMSQTEREFSLGRRDWTSDFRIEGTEKSDQFGIIGTDRGNCSGLGSLSGSDTMGSTNFVSPGKIMMGQTQWTDDLGLRNLDVSGCVGSEGSSEAREHGVGQTDWSSDLGLSITNMPGGLGNGGLGQCRELGVGQKDWTPDLGLRNIDVSGVIESTGPSEARECGVGQTDWVHSFGMRNEDAPNDTKLGDLLLSREHGVGQADWTTDLKLSSTDLGTGGSLREHGVGQMDWPHDLDLRNTNQSSPLELGGSGEARECGVGQMDWQKDLGLRNTDLSGSLDLGGPSKARERGVGQVHWSGDVDLASPRLSSGLESGEPSETRELGVGEVSRPGIADSQYGADSSQPLEDGVSDMGMDSRETANSGSSPSGCRARSPPSGSQGLLQDMLANSTPRPSGQEKAALGPRGWLEEEEEEETIAHDEEEEEPELRRDPLPSCRPQPDGEASRTEEVDGGWASRGDGPAAPRLLPSPPSRLSSPDFSFIEDTEVLDSAMYRSRASLGRKRGHRAPAIRPGGTLGLSEADHDAWIFQDSTEPRTSRVPSSDDEVVEEPQSRRTRMSLGTKGLKVNLFPGLSPSALKAKLRPRNRSAEEGEQAESKSTQKEPAVQRSKSCKVPGLGKPLALPPKPEKSSGSEGSSPNWLQALKLKKKRV